MKPIHSFFILSLCCCTPAMAQQKKLTLFNPVNTVRTDELVVLKRADPALAFLGKSPGAYPEIRDKQGRAVVVQLDDLDQDGKWDEAVFLYTFQPLEKVVFSLKASAKPPEKGIARAHVRHRRKNADDTFGPSVAADSVPAGQPNTDFSKVKLPPFLTEGPAWENDKVGFRLYLDVRNGKDIWGKTTAKMMMDTVGTDPGVIYHHRADWGMDIYKVGSSLSAGALGLSFRLKDGRDSLIRLGGASMGKVIYHRLADGPLRAVFRLEYPEWKAVPGMEALSLTEEISIWGGQYFYESRIQVRHMPENAALVTGFANLFQLPVQELENTGTKGIYSYGLQSENDDRLGLALLAPAATVSGYEQVPSTGKDIKDTYLLRFKPEHGQQPVRFRFYAAWEPADPRFAAEGSFRQFMDQQAACYTGGLQYSWK